MTAPGAAVVLAVGGLAGTGKSTLAHAVAPALGAAVIRSDVVRKRLFGLAPEVPLGPEGYGSAADARVAAALVAAVAAAAGASVVVDATFRDPALRDRVAAAAGNRRFLGIWLTAPLAERERRVAARTGDASDADVAVVRAQADAGAPPGWAAVDASGAAAALNEVRRVLGML